jgi:uncharacterized membrane protein HdeD (DUF308 family)
MFGYILHPDSLLFTKQGILPVISGLNKRGDMKKFSWMKIPRILLCFLGIEMAYLSMFGSVFILFLLGVATITIGVYLEKIIKFLKEKMR